MLLERCIEKIEKHNHKNPNKVIFVNFNNTEHLKAFKEHFIFGSNFVGVAANKGADNLPTYDEILDVIENSANNTFVEGIGAFLRLFGQKQVDSILNQLINTSISSNAVVLLFQCEEVLQQLIKKDPRVETRVILVDGERDQLPKITFIKEDIARSISQNVYFGVSSLIDRLDESASKHIYVSTRFGKKDFAESLYNIDELTSFFEIIRTDYITSLLQRDENCLNSSQWKSIAIGCKEYGNFENYFHKLIGSAHSVDLYMKSWTSLSDDKKAAIFVMLKTNVACCNNRCLRVAIANCDSIDGLLLEVYKTIINENTKSKAFWEFYDERKQVLQAMGTNEHIANSFCDYAESYDENAIYALTDITQAEKKLTLKLIAKFNEKFTKKELLSILKHTYNDLYLYLLNYDYKLQEIDDYFNEYKYLKVVNSVTDNFRARVMQEAIQRNFYRILPTRSERLGALEKDNSILYFVDALGLEYMSFIAQKASEMQMMMSVDFCHCDLPSITSQNKEFIDVFKNAGADIIDNIKELDEIKHSGTLDYDYTKSPYPTYLADELDRIQEILEKINNKLGATYDRAFIISDHGASRLAVISAEETKWEMVNKGEHCGRCCKVSEQIVDEPNEFMTEDNGYWVLANYDRIKGGRPGTVEVHGGATLEEVCVPIIEFTRMPENIKIDVITKLVETAYKKKPVLKFTANCKLSDVSITIGDKRFVATSDDKKHFSVELQGIRLEKEYTFDVWSNSNVICRNLKFRLKSAGMVDNDIL